MWSVGWDPERAQEQGAEVSRGKNGGWHKCKTAGEGGTRVTTPCVASYVGLALGKHRDPLEEMGFGRGPGAMAA